MNYMGFDNRKEPKTFSNRQFGGGSLRLLRVFVNNIIYDLQMCRIYIYKLYSLQKDILIFWKYVWFLLCNLIEELCETVLVYIEQSTPKLAKTEEYLNS